MGLSTSATSSSGSRPPLRPRPTYSKMSHSTARPGEYVRSTYAHARIVGIGGHRRSPQRGSGVFTPRRPRPPPHRPPLPIRRLMRRRSGHRRRAFRGAPSWPWGRDQYLAATPPTVVVTTTRSPPLFDPRRLPRRFPLFPEVGTTPRSLEGAAAGRLHRLRCRRLAAGGDPRMTAAPIEPLRARLLADDDRLSTTRPAMARPRPGCPLLVYDLPRSRSGDRARVAVASRQAASCRLDILGGSPAGSAGRGAGPRPGRTWWPCPRAGPYSTSPSAARATAVPPTISSRP